MARSRAATRRAGMRARMSPRPAARGPGSPAGEVAREGSGAADRVACAMRSLRSGGSARVSQAPECRQEAGDDPDVVGDRPADNERSVGKAASPPGPVPRTGSPRHLPREHLPVGQQEGEGPSRDLRRRLGLAPGEDVLGEAGEPLPGLPRAPPRGGGPPPPPRGRRGGPPPPPPPGGGGGGHPPPPP